MDLFKLFGTIAIDNAAANNAIDETSGKARGLSEQLDITSSIGGGFGAVIGKGMSAAGKAITTVGGAVLRGVGMVAKAGTVAVAAGAAAYGALTVNAMKAAGSLEQNMGGSEAVFGEYAAGIQQTAQQAFSTAGLATSDYLATANKMGALFQGAGFGIEESANLATLTMQRAADVASIMGLDTASAMESIAGAAKGNFTMMDNLGVAINDTTLQNYALEKGIKKSTQQMTTQEKVGLAMEMFMERTAYAAGNYAKENETLAGALGTAKAAMTNFLDGSGGINDLVPALENAGEVITKNLVEVMPRLSTGLSEGMKQIAPMIPTMLQTAIPGIAEGVASLATGFADAMPGIVDALVASAPTITEGFGKVFESVGDSMPQIMSTLTPAIADGLSGALSLVGVEIESSDIQATMESLFSGISSTFDTLGTEFGDIAESVGDAFGNVVSTLSENGVSIEGVFDGINEAITQVSGVIESFVGMSGSALSGLTDWATTDGTFLQTMFENMGTALSTGAGTLSYAMAGVGHAIEGDWNAAWAAFELAGTVAMNGIEKGVGNTMDYAASKVNDTEFNVREPNLDGLNTIPDAADENMKELDAILMQQKGLGHVETGGFTSSITGAVEGAEGELDKIDSKTVSPKFDPGDLEKAEAMYGGVAQESDALDGKTASPKVDASSAETAKEQISGTANAIADLTSIGTVALKINTSDLNQATAQVQQTAQAIQSAFEFPLKTPPVNTSSLDAAVEAAGAAAAAIVQAFSSMVLSVPAPTFSGGNVSGSITIGTEQYASGGVMMKPTAFGINPNTGNVMVGGEAGAEAIAPIDVLQGYVAQAVASQNAAQTSILERMLDGIAELNANIGASMREAVEGMSFSINNREFGRLVKGVT